MNELLKAAGAYLASNISVIPTDDVKRSIVSWKPYQEKIPTQEQAKALFNNVRAKGIAVICGAVSGNIEVIDIDTKYDITGTLYDDYMQLINEHNADLFSRLYTVQTKSGGYHIYYKCEVIEGNQKLSQRYATDEEIKDNPNVKVQVLIETRGEGGYVIAPPSNGYNKISGGKIPIITLDERELLLNLARTFNKVVVAPERPAVIVDHKKYGVSPFEDYNSRGDIESVLVNHGWTYQYERGGKRYYRRPGKDEGISGDWWPEKKWFSVFTTSCQFETNKAYNPVGVFAMLECNNDFSAAAKKLIAMGYGEKRVSFGKMEGDVLKKQRDGVERDAIITHLVKNYDEVKNVEQAEIVIEKIEKQHGEILGTFWDVSFDAEGRVNKTTINRFKFERFLSNDGGFWLYFYDVNSNIYKVIQERNGLIEEASSEQIKKFIKDYVLSLPPSFDGITKEALMEVVYKGSETYFSKSFLEFLDGKKIDFLKDTATEAFFPFRNGVVVVTKDNICLKSYGELGKSIWKTQVIDANIDILPTLEAEDAEFCQFVQKICEDDVSRIGNALSIIGYLCHKFKDTTRPFSVILAEENEDEKKGGGTGKGIFVKALKYVLNVETIDGKNFKIDKSFAFQRVGLDTNIIAIEDVRKKVDFEGFYSIITEGITVEKKNKDELYIPYTDSPKVMFTTNYTIPSVGNHARRRQRVIEFGGFFTPENTPADYFKHRLFDDWDKDEWNRFYNLIFWCVQQYLLTGIIEIQNSEAIKRKHIKLSYSEEFLEWWDGYVSNGCANWKPFREMYSDFLNSNDYEKREYSQKRFKAALEESSGKMGYKMEGQRNWQNAGQHEVRLTPDNRVLPLD